MKVTIIFGLYLGGSISLLVGAFINQYAQDYVYNAVRYYNRYILFEENVGENHSLNYNNKTINILQYNKRF